MENTNTVPAVKIPNTESYMNGFSRYFIIVAHAGRTARTGIKTHFAVIITSDETGKRDGLYVQCGPMVGTPTGAEVKSESITCEKCIKRFTANAPYMAAPSTTLTIKA